MKRLTAFLTLVILLALAGPGWGALPANDPFTGSGALSASWTQVTNASGSWTRASGKASGSTNYVNYWSGDSFGPDQWASTTYIDLTSRYCGPGVRLDPINVNGYVLGVDSTTVLSIYRFDNGTGTRLGAAITVTTLAGGENLELSVTGSTFTASVNGTPVGTTRTDTTYTSGAPGILSSSTSRTLDNFNADQIIGPPSVTTQPVSNIAGTTATGNGTVVGNGGAAVTRSGICYNTTGTPTIISDTIVDSTTTPDQGPNSAFTSSITGLMATTRYYVRAFATNSQGTSYGAQVVFQTTPHHYYVSNAGSDSNDGYTTTSSLQTMAAVNALTLLSGDIVYFNRNDTWTDAALSMTADGVTYSAYGTGNKPKIRKTTVITAGPWSGGPIYTMTKADCTWIIENGVALPKAADAGSVVAGTWFFAGTTITYGPTDGNAPGTIGPVEVPANGTAVSRNTTGVIIDNLNFYQCASGIYNSASYTMDNLTIQNCLFNYCGVGVDLKTKDGVDVSSWTVNACTFDYCGNNIYLQLAAGHYETITATLTNNIITHSNLAFGTTSTYSDPEGLSLQNQKNSLIEGNDIGGSANTLSGIVHWTSNPSTSGKVNTGTIIRKNYIHGVGGTGIIWGSGNYGNVSGLVYNNIINTFGTAGIKINGAQDSTLKMYILNNTIYNSSGIGLWLATTDYVIAKNNIVSTCTTMARSDVAVLHNDLSNNCYVGAGSGSPFYYSSGNRTLAYWQGTAGFDTVGCITADPVFLNAGGSFALATDFQLPKTSPAAKAGVNVGLTTDYWGNPVPPVKDAGKYPIGVYMYPFIGGGVGFWVIN